MANASFIFDTNIEAVTGQVQRSLAMMQRNLTAAQQKLAQSPQGSAFLRDFERQIGSLGAQGAQRLRALEADFEQAARTARRTGQAFVAPGDGRPLQAQARDIRSDIHRQQAEITQKAMNAVPQHMQDLLPIIRAKAEQGRLLIDQGVANLYRTIAQAVNDAAAKAGLPMPAAARIGKGGEKHALPTGATVTPGTDEAMLAQHDYARHVREVNESDLLQRREKLQAQREATRAELDAMSQEKRQRYMEGQQRQARRHDEAIMNQRRLEMEAADLSASGEARRISGTRQIVDSQGRIYSPGGGLPDMPGMREEKTPSGRAAAWEKIEKDAYAQNEAHNRRVNKSQRDLEADAHRMNQAYDKRAKEAEQSADREQRQAQTAGRTEHRAHKANSAYDARVRQVELGNQLESDISRGAAERLRSSNNIRTQDGRWFRMQADGRAYQISQQSLAARYEAEYTRWKMAEAKAAQRNAQLEAQRGLTGGRSFIGGFTGGLTSGGFDRSQRGLAADLGGIGATAGSLVKYAALSTMIFGLMGAAAGAKGEIIDFRDSLTDLGVAMGNTGGPTQGFINELSGFSRFAGANPGEALDTAARGIRAFGDATQSLEQQEEIGARFTETVSKLALIINRDIGQARGELIAVGAAFDIEPEGFNRILDALASAKQSFGADPEQVMQGVASIGIAAKEAGYNVEETFNAIALIQSRTDQSGQVIATRLTRAFGIIGGSRGQSALRQLNQSLPEDAQVELTGNIAEQIAQVRSAWDGLGQKQQDALRTQLGGNANLRELLPLLTEEDLLLQALTDSYAKAGEGEDEFRRKAEDIPGTIKQIVGNIKNLVAALSEAGIFDFFGVALLGIEPFLNSLTELIGVWNELPEPIRKSAVYMAELWALQKLMTATGLGSMLGIGAGKVATTAVVGAGLGAGTAGGALAGAGWGAAGASAGAQVGTGMARFAVGSRMLAIPNAVLAAGTSLVMAISSVALRIKTLALTPGGFNMKTAGTALIGAMVVNEAFQSSSAINRALAAGSDRLGAAFESTADGLQSEAEAIGATSKELSSASSGLMGTVINALMGGATGKETAQLDAQRKQFNEAARRVEKLEAERARSDKPMVDLSTPESIQQSFEAMTEAGRDAGTQLDALIEALRDLGNESEAAGHRLQAGEGQMLAIYSALSLSKGIGSITEQEGALAGQFAWKWDRDKVNQIEASRQNRDILAGVDVQALATSVEADIDAFVGGKTMLTDEQVEQLKEVARARVKAGIKGFENLAPDIQAQILHESDMAIKTELGKLTTVEDKPTSLEEVTRQTPGLAKAYGQIIASKASLSGKAGGGALLGAEAELQRLEEVRALLRQEGADRQTLEIFDQAVREAKLKVQQATIASLDTDLVVLQSLLPDTDAIGRQQALISKINEKLEVVTDADERRRLEAEKRDAEQVQMNNRLAQRQSERTAGVDPRNTVGNARAALTNTKDALAVFVAKGDTDSAAYWDAWRANEEAKIALMRAETDRANSVIEMGVDPASALQKATANLLIARNNLADELRGTAAWNRAWRALQNMKIELATAEREAMSVRRQLEGDITDPLFMAREEVRKQRDELRAALRRGAPQDVVDKGQLDLRKAQNSRERTAFDQRMADARINEQLGRISHGQYVSYLESERDRLLAIRDRTRQQQDMLNQAEMALKEMSDQAQGMWNIGDINMPTIYEVRRSMAARAAGQAYQDNRVANINVSGADLNQLVAAVTKHIDDQLGTQVGAYGSSGRKVR